MEMAARHFIIFFLTFVSVFAVAQNPLENKISVDISNKPTDQVLEKIESLGGFYFSYNSSVIDADKMVSIKAEDKTVEFVLRELFGERLLYKHRGSYIIIQKAVPELADKKKVILTGNIVDKKTGKRIPNVTVYEARNLKSSVTGDDGNFDLKVANESEEITLLISKKDYRDTLIRINPNAPVEFSIELEPEQPSDVDIFESKADRLTMVKMFINEHIIDNMKNVNLSEETGFQFSVLPSIGTNGALNGKVTNNFSINLICGYANGLDGVELGAFVNIIRDTVRGVQLAGFGNIVGGDFRGTQAAGFINVGMSKFRGAQLAGFGNINNDTVRGFQGAGFINTAPIIYGTQAAGFINVVSNKVKGAQLAGFINVAKETDGAQIAGFINVTEKLKGVQISVFNFADTVASGTPIGFFSYVKNGFHKLELSHSDYLHANVSFKTGTHKFYNIFTGGYQFDDTTPLMTFGYGLGTQFNLGKRFYTNLEVTAQNVSTTNPFVQKNINLLNQFNWNLGINLGKKISLNGGPVLNAYVTRKYNIDTNTYGDFSPSNVLYEETRDGTNLKLWLGYRAALRF